MNLLNHIAAQIIAVHVGNNWTDVNLTDSLKSIHHSQAIQIHPNSPNSIAMLVHHILFWNNVISKRIQGIDVDVPTENGFKHEPIHTEADWQKLIKTCMDSAKQLANDIENFDPNQLFKPLIAGGSTAYKTFQGQSEHVHYHLGQIVVQSKNYNH